MRIEGDDDYADEQSMEGQIPDLIGGVIEREFTHLPRNLRCGKVLQNNEQSANGGGLDKSSIFQAN
jgi:hypothetical protein